MPKIQKNIQAIANNHIGAGRSVIPLGANKRPAVKWKEFQTRIPERDELTYTKGIILICGKVSGNLEVLDIDLKHVKNPDLVFRQFKKRVQKALPELWDKLTIQQTVSGGYHLAYTCRTIEGNQVFARNEAREAIIETRGEGGYIVMAPSRGYELLQGNFKQVERITQKERETLFEICRSFDESGRESRKDSERSQPEPVDPAEREQIQKDVETTLKRIVKAKVDITKGYTNWRNIGFAFIWAFGENAWKYFNEVSQFHPKYTEKDCRKEFLKLLKHHNEKSEGAEVTIGTFFDLAIEHRVRVPPQKDVVKIGSGKALPPFEADKVLAEIIKQLSPVNFRKLAGLKKRETVLLKHILVCCIREILKKAKQNGLGLAKISGQYCVYTGTHWRPVDENILKAFLGHAAERLGVGDIDAEYCNFQKKLFEQFETSANFSTPERPKITLVNFPNGTLEIDDRKQTVKLRPHDPKDGLTHVLPFTYDTNATCPIFQKYLDRVLPDKNLQKILLEYIGYLFVRTSTLKLEKALILCGPGANGKSVAADVITALLGRENVTSYSLQSLTDQGGHYRAQLANKLLNYIFEIGTRLESSIFKALVSGEPIEARPLYKDPIIIADYAKLIGNCNELPRDVEQTHAFFRRFLIIPFNQTIPEKEQDKALAQKIIEKELSGVFNVVLHGLRRLLENRNFTHSIIVDETLTTYKRESDSVQMFLYDEGYVKSQKKFAASSKLYDEYRYYTDDNGHKPVSQVIFSKRLKASGFVFERKENRRGFYIQKGG